jgi:hypothetical protein
MATGKREKKTNFRPQIAAMPGNYSPVVPGEKALEMCGLMVFVVGQTSKQACAIQYTKIKEG